MAGVLLGGLPTLKSRLEGGGGRGGDGFWWKTVPEPHGGGEEGVKVDVAAGLWVE